MWIGVGRQIDERGPLRKPLASQPGKESSCGNEKQGWQQVLGMVLEHGLRPTLVELFVTMDLEVPKNSWRQKYKMKKKLQLKG